MVVGGEESTDEEEGSGKESGEESGEEKGKKGKKGGEGDESSDEEYFNEKRCEWRSKDELRAKKGKKVAEEGKQKEKK